MRKADMRCTDMRKADMRGANLDLSCWPLWCGSLGVIVDKRIAAQLAYHFCRIICDDGEVKREKVKNGTVDFVFETLVLDGPMKTGEIIYKTGLEPKQVYNAVYYLKMRRLIEKEDRKWRIKR